MKQCISRSAVLCFVLALMVGSHSLAKGRKSLTIYEKSRVNDVVLEPGDYKVEIVENGDVSRRDDLQRQRTGCQGCGPTREA